MEKTPSEKAMEMALTFESRGDIEKAEYWFEKAVSLEKKYGNHADSNSGEKQGVVKTFSDKQTIFAGDATDTLFSQALPSVPKWPKERIENEYQGFVRSWGSKTLIEGSAEDLRKRVLTNLKKSAITSGFQYFTIHLRENMGLAQVITWSDGGGVSVCLWRSEDGLYLCGNSHFE